MQHRHLSLIHILGKDKDILRNSILAASVGIISNIFLTLNFGKNGSAIVFYVIIEPIDCMMIDGIPIA